MKMITSKKIVKSLLIFGCKKKKNLQVSCTDDETARFWQSNYSLPRFDYQTYEERKRPRKKHHFGFPEAIYPQSFWLQ